MPVSKILVPVDGSENSRRALAQAASMSGAGSSITLLYVIEVPPTVYVASQKLLDEVKAKFREESARVLDQYRALAQKSKAAVDTVALEGDAAQSIIDYAQKGRFDMIVMGSRGMGKLKGMVLGSVSRKVLHHAKCPVLIVK
jgi:nucleotide-binding universal stress UspA family protein